ncbi:MAG: LysR family transcriptional regulator [Pseudobdellovibrionaceae bacterium]
MELNHLRCFWKFHTKAALRLHISQSALSKAVALLEQAEGVRLFVRSKSGVTLTALGLKFFREAKRFLRRSKKLKMHVGAERKRSRGVGDRLRLERGCFSRV